MPHFMLIIDKGELYPIGEYEPATPDNVDLMPENAFAWNYFRIDRKTLRPVFDATGNKIAEAHETEEYNDFISQGFDHEFSPVNTTNISQAPEEGKDPDTNVTLFATRYFEESAYFVTYDDVSQLLEFLRVYSSGLNFELGYAYDGGVWGDKNPIAYIVIDSPISGLADLSVDADE
jgi:hypothetical protein